MQILRYAQNDTHRMFHFYPVTQHWAHNHLKVIQQ